LTRLAAPGVHPIVLAEVIAVARTHTFTSKSAGRPVAIVLSQVILIEGDEFSESIMIYLMGGHKIGVAETLEEVIRVIEAA